MRVILPNSLVNEVKGLPNSKVSMMQEVYVRMHGKYTGAGIEHPEIIGAVRDDLTRAIASTLSDLQDEISCAYDNEIGACKEWAEFLDL
jgi:hypothetical protein